MNSTHAPGSGSAGEDVVPLTGWEMGDGREANAAAPVTLDQQYWYLLGRRAGGQGEPRRGESALQQMRLELDQLRQEMAAAKMAAAAVSGGRLANLFKRPRAETTTANSPAAVAVAANGDAVVLRPRSHLQPEKVVIVAALGIGDDELSRVAGMAAGQMATGRVLPIVLTDSDRLEILRRHRLPLEYVPPPAQQRRFAPDKNWNLYLRRRFAIICRKWRPGALIVFGGGSGLLVEAAKELGLMPA